MVKRILPSIVSQSFYRRGRCKFWKLLLTSLILCFVALTITSQAQASPTPTEDNPPTVEIISPSDGETVSGTVRFSAHASDDYGVEKFELYIDDELKRTDNYSPAVSGTTMNWDCDTTPDSIDYIPNGSHTFKAKAYDTAGQTNVDTISFVVNNIGTITIQGKATLEGATNHSGITIEVWLNGLAANTVASTTTGTDGSYQMSNVPSLSGSEYYSIVTTKNGYSWESARISASEASPGSTVVVSDMILHNQKWVSFNWVYQPDGTTNLSTGNLSSGSAVLYSAVEGAGGDSSSGFIFSTATATDVVADVYFLDSMEYPYTFWANNGSGGVHDMGSVSLDSIAEAPDASNGIGAYEFYNILDTDIIIGHTYCIVTKDGAHYAKIHVTDMGTGEAPPLTATISGKVTDGSTKDPIGGATISANGYSTTTDLNGNYSLSVPEGTYTVTASADGYESHTYNISVNAGRTVTVNFSLARVGAKLTAYIEGRIEGETEWFHWDVLGTSEPELKLELRGTNSQGEIVRYEWNFGDGSTAEGEYTSHTYYQGNWNITLTVYDKEGNSASETLRIEVRGVRTEVDVDTKYWEAGNYQLRIGAQASPGDVSSITISGPSYLDTATVNKPGDPESTDNPKQLYDDSQHWDGEANDGYWLVELNIAATPTTSDTITFHITYGDGSTETKQKTIDGVFTETPTLVSPSDGSTINTLTPIFEWSNPSISELTYSVQVWDRDFNRVYEVYDLPDGTTSHTIPSGYLDWEITYYWLVGACDANGNEALTNCDAFTTHQFITGTISGKVTDPADVGIYKATVLASGHSTTTDTYGNYSFSLSPGTYSLTASASEYKSQTKDNVAVTAGGITTVNFSLTPTGVPVSDVQKYAPTLIFDSDEQYFSVHIHGDDYLVSDNHENYDDDVIRKGKLGSGPNKGKEGWDKDNNGEPDKYICYYYIYEDAPFNSYVIQYWYYYAFNPAWDAHEHDFELVQVWVDEDTGSPFYVFSSEHVWDNGIYWDGKDSLTLYVTKGGHGMDSYYSVLTFKPDKELTAEKFTFIPLDSLRIYEDIDLDGNKRFYSVSWKPGEKDPAGYKYDEDHSFKWGERGKAPWYQSRYSNPLYPPLLAVLLKSPGELRVYDSDGRVTGLVNGEIKKEIPNSDYYKNTVIISPPSGPYTYEVVGTDEGAYKLSIFSSPGAEELLISKEETNTFDAIDIPVIAKATHQYTIDWDALSRGEEGVTVQIDFDGDGKFDWTGTSDKDFTPEDIDSTPPTASITSPSAGAAVRGSVVIKGTASDENFKQYKVEYGKGTEPSSWTVIVTSGSQVINDTLAVWDTSSLNDGSYTLKLIARDLFGNSSQVKVSLRVDNHPPEATLIDYPTDTVTGNTPKVAVTFTWTGSDPDGITPVEKLVYQYKLEGYLDYQDWSDWNQETNKTYILPSGNYTFNVRAKDEAGNYPDENDPATAKSSFTVSLPIIIYPNPCYPNQGQIITMTNLPLASNEIYIYDLGGNLVRTLGESEVNIEGGSKTVTWDCRNDNGEVVTRDIYIYFIPSATEKKTGKIAIIK